MDERKLEHLVFSTGHCSYSPNRNCIQPSREDESPSQATHLAVIPTSLSYLRHRLRECPTPRTLRPTCVRRYDSGSYCTRAVFSEKNQQVSE